MKSFILALLLVVSTSSLFAQGPQGAGPAGGGNNSKLKIGRVFGKVVESATKQSVGYASVAIFKSHEGKDSLVGGALTSDNGEFNITELPMGGLKVKISFLGFKEFSKIVKILPTDVEEDLGDVKLETDSEVLKAVEVKGEKVSTMISLEKRVFNVEKNITTTGGTAEDVLKNVPSVTVDVDGNAQLRDKGTTVYVDGKPTLMALNQIPADNIESVEVITNPSAKYEASTTGGILNIVLKKNRKAGYNGMVNLGVGNQNRYNGLLNLNVNDGRWNVSGSYNINHGETPTGNYAYRTNLDASGNPKSYYNQNTTTLFENTFQMGRVGIDYNVNNRNTISLLGNVVNGKFNINSFQNYEYKTLSNTIDSFGTRTQAPQNEFVNSTIETQWKKTFAKKNESLSASANYTWGNFSNAALWKTTSFDGANKEKLNSPETVLIDGKTMNQQTVFQLDYVNPLNDSTKIETGARFYWKGTDQNFVYKAKNLNSAEYVQDNFYSQLFTITERINAAYITYSSKFKNQINYQAGVRFEQSSLDVIPKTDPTKNTGFAYPNFSGNDVANSLLNSFFPSLFLSKKLDETTELGLNFSRKIQRPGWRQLGPGIQGNDKQNVQLSNPSLQPEFVNNAEFNFNKVFGENNWLSSIYIEDETNTIKPYSYRSPLDSNVLISTWVNGAYELTYGWDNTLKLGLTKNLEVSMSANIIHYNLSVLGQTNSAWAASEKLGITWRLPADFAVQVNANNEGDRPLSQGYRKGVAFMDFAVKKSFFNKAATLTFNINDVFDSRKDVLFLTQPTFTQETFRRRETRNFRISLQIPFGKVDASMFKKKGKKPEGQQEQPDYGG